jgi:hypothetical protein
MKRTTGAALLLFAVFLLFFVSDTLSSASRPRADDPRPVLAVTPAASTGAIRRQEPQVDISESAWQQVQALEIDKESRTPAQQKIDSQLLYAIKMRRGQGVAAGVQTLAVDVGADDTGLVTIDVTAIVDQQLLRDLTGMGVVVSDVFPQYHSLRAVALLDQLETIAGYPQVRFIQPKQEAIFSQAPMQTYPPPASADFSNQAAQVRAEIREAMAASIAPNASLKIGIATSEGDTTHKAFSARGTFNSDGTGIKIGVLSDGVTNLATSQASGDLGAVTVLPGQAGSGNEGTAMLEIIHDLAPGAQLFFATAGGGITNFAQNIRDLRTAGCDIILDDVGYFVESPFQDGQTSGVISTNNAGVATQAVNDVVASGALYFSSAANSGNKNDGTSGTWEGDFVDGGTLSLVPGGKVHDFDPTAVVSQNDTITASGGPLNLHWADPLGGASNDYDLFVFNGAGTAVVASSTNIQSGTQDPYEQVSSAADILNNRVVILQKTGAANRFLHLSTNRGRLNFNTEGDTHGHNAASGAYGVAAVCAVCTFPAVFSSANMVETFSSDGPRRIFFNGNSTAITPGDFSSSGGTVLQKPDVTAADGVSVSGAGGFPTKFYGTSAAAPHAAAIAALIRSANPALTSAQIKAVLTSTAVDIEGAGTDRNSGAGIVMPYAALQSMGAPVVGKAFLELGSISQTETGGNGSGSIDPGESGTLNIILNNTGLLAATGINTTLTSSTSGVTIVNGNSTYPNLAASGGSGANNTPFSISLGSSMPADPNVKFTLTIIYTGGHQPSQSWDFNVQFGLNGSFESGDFSGWNVSTVSTGGAGTPFAPWTVSQAGAGGFSSYGIATTSPQAGVYDAWNGFDGAGPMEYRMYQDVTVPSSGMPNLTWKDRAQWNFCCGATVGRTYSVQLRNPVTNAVLTTLYTFSTPTTAGYHDSGWLAHGSDLSSYAGQKVRLYFLEVIPENFTGPGQIEFDAISLGNGPLPTPTPTPTPGPPPTLPALFGSSKSGQLFSIDLTTGAGTLIGNIPVGTLPAPFNGTTEIVYNNSTKRAFSQFNDGNFAGQEFNINTGAAIGSPISNGGSYDGLEWVGSTLYGAVIFSAGGPSQLKTLNPFTGTSTLIGSTGIGPIDGLAYDQTTGTMYGTTGGTKNSSNLVTINLTTGVATVIGSVGFNAGSLKFGLDGNLYAGSVGGTGNLYRINKSNGASTLVGNTGFINVTGLALVTAVPPPPTPTPTPKTVQFSSSSYTVSEGSPRVDIALTRSGDTTSSAAVNFATVDGVGLQNCNVFNGIASPRCDYINTLGTMTFAANETSKSFSIAIVDDSYAEGNETFTVSLSGPSGATLGAQSTATVNIIDNDSSNGANPIDNTNFFVRQQYIDFLNREPDPPGFTGWVNTINNCTGDTTQCDRIHVSQLFFQSTEFQQRGYFVYRFYPVAFGRKPDYGEFVPDLASVSGFLTDAQLEAAKVAFIANFMARTAFASTYNGLTNQQYVDALLNTAGVTLLPSPATRQALIDGLNNSTLTRAVVLRQIVESAEVSTKYNHQAYAVMEYFGYLRRQPDAFYLDWIIVLDQSNDPRGMVTGFVNSLEYRNRFGP